MGYPAKRNPVDQKEKLDLLEGLFPFILLNWFFPCLFSVYICSFFSMGQFTGFLFTGLQFGTLLVIVSQLLLIFSLLFCILVLFLAMS